MTTTPNAIRRPSEPLSRPTSYRGRRRRDAVYTALGIALCALAAVAVVILGFALAVVTSA